MVAGTWPAMMGGGGRDRCPWRVELEDEREQAEGTGVMGSSP
jgi:hypothetical protein